MEEMKLPESSLATLQGSVVQVSVPLSVAFDLDKIQRVERTIFERLGHPNCYSGWDVRWDIFRQYAVDEKLNVRPLGL